VHTHHNSEDRPETVDPRSLHDLAALTAAYLYLIANAGEADAAYLLHITEARGYGQILAAASGPVGTPQALRAALDRVAYQVEREKDAVRSVLRVAPQAKAAAAAGRLARFADEQMRRLRDTAGFEPAAAAEDAQLKAARGLVVRRKRMGTLPLDDVPPPEREGHPNGAWSGVAISALYWCDGKRDLAEVIRLARQETGNSKFDYTGYFKFLARKGYVDLLD
jgi:hypothetical protein